MGTQETRCGRGDEALCDQARLEALARTGLLDSPAEESFDRVTRLATKLLGVPVSLVSLVGKDRQFFKSCTGLAEPWATLRTTGLSHSFCQHVVIEKRPLVIEDARRDPRVKDNQAIPDIGVVAYAGYPLVTAEGCVLGSFCAIDRVPRRWRPDELDTLRDLAGFVVDEIELRTARRQALEAVEREALLRSAVMDSAPAGITGIDPAGRCVFVNRAAAAMLGYAPQELLGRSLHQTVHHSWADGTPYPAEACPLAQLAREQGRCEVGDELLWRKDGTSFPVKFTAASLVDGGRVQGAVVVFQDMTQEKRHEEELRRAKDAAEEASRAKDRFVAVLSHELRTPLMPVLMSASALAGDPRLPEELRAEALLVQRSAEQEARLIDDLLDMTGLALGRLRLKREGVDLHAILTRLQEDLAEQYRQRHLRLEMHLDAGDRGQARVRGDAHRLQQVFRNLMENAAKFTPPGGVVQVRTYQRTEGPQPLIGVEVRDEGIGIDARLLGRMFSGFEQQEEAISRVYGGLGLGLKIARGLVELHGGTITARSEGKGRGSAFVVELPMAAALDETPAPKANGSAGPLRILLVEDHAGTLAVLTRLLRGLGHEVVTAVSTAEALAAAATRAFDLLISDIGLPDRSGWELMAELRHRAPLPAIALSGFGMEEDVKRSLEAGFAMHLVKPVDLDQLQGAIGKVAGTHASQ